MKNLIKLLVLLAIVETPLAYAVDPIVYSRCLRTAGTLDISAEVTFDGVPQTVTRTMRGVDVYDVMPDVSNFFQRFSAPCDLMLRAADGTETVLYDCSTTSTVENACAALDASVSFDANTVAFSVFRGSLYNPGISRLNGRILDHDADDATVIQIFSPPGSTGTKVLLPNKRLESTGAHLHTVDVATGTVSAMPFVDDIYDSGPTFISENRLAFTSNRDGHRSTLVFRSGSAAVGTRIWTIDIDGSNPDLASHHSLSQEQHPIMLKDGRLAYSSWQIFGGLPFRHTNGGAGGFTTLANLFHIYTQSPDGAHNFPFYGQHSGASGPSYFGEGHSAAHFIAQTSDERVWFADYYRRNNNGLGAVIGVMSEPPGQEGIAPEGTTSINDIFVPRDVINLASWAGNSDTSAGIMAEPWFTHPNYSDPLPYAGKLGHPAALTNNGLMVAWGKGPCSSVAGNGIFAYLGLATPPLTSGSGSGNAINLVTSLNMDTPGCDIGLYKTTVIPSIKPDDLEQIVDSVDWHEIMGRALVPYSAIYGVAQPAVIPAADELTSHPQLQVGTPFGLLGAASITDRETHPLGGIKFAGEAQFNLQGTDTVNYLDEDLCGVRILAVLPNRNRNVDDEISNIAGERVAILGEFSVQNRDSNDNIIIDPSGNPDTSFLVRFPANAPYLMQGIDCDGRTLNTDMTWQHLRPGEKKTCGGCHVHSRPSRIDFTQSYANTANYNIPTLGEGTVPLLTGKTGNVINTRTETGYGFQVEFAKDIQPIFDDRCISCHGGESPAAGLALDRPGVDRESESSWWCLVADASQRCVPPGLQHNTGAGSNDISFRRPQMTRYIRAFNSLGSLLYWKAANQRTDSNTNETNADDIDYITDHPTAITADELGLISRWIDTGAGGGPLELLDTQKPTLHLTATVIENVVTAFQVGTVDIGSGINVASLVVCVLDSNDTCLSNLATTAQMSGITTIPLTTVLDDPNTKLYASVEDLTGNITEVHRTIKWFIDQQSLTDLIFSNGFE
ncbi:hypothetical protein MNBD_GAMMA01-1589 [hydrothermal vent metagenome]|uniref:Hydrazine synthase alpha subunit middle domain-containing protein n=1 Tax=hydrothermal vent metagenome TaxID=652676 RepID=A0A3B0VGY0_9ZZZZ